MYSLMTNIYLFYYPFYVQPRVEMISHVALTSVAMLNIKI